MGIVLKLDIADRLNESILLHTIGYFPPSETN